MAVEAEYEPGPEVEQDARDCLSLAVVDEPRPIEAAIALKYPADIQEAYDLAEAIADASLSYCVLYADGSRFPLSGWLTGSVVDHVILRGGDCHDNIQNLQLLCAHCDRVKGNRPQ